jgi:hypothetical protein
MCTVHQAEISQTSLAAEIILREYIQTSKQASKPAAEN